MSVGVISKYLLRAQELGLKGWPLLEEIDEMALQHVFFPQAILAPRTDWVEPDGPQIHVELWCKGAGVT